MKDYKKLSDPGEIVAQRRSELDMTQIELAEKLDYPSVNFISMLEKKRSKVPLEKSVKFAKVLEIDEKWFIEKIMRDRYPIVAEVLFNPNSRK